MPATGLAGVLERAQTKFFDTLVLLVLQHGLAVSAASGSARGLTASRFFTRKRRGDGYG